MTIWYLESVNEFGSATNAQCSTMRSCFGKFLEDLEIEL